MLLEPAVLDIEDGELEEGEIDGPFEAATYAVADGGVHMQEDVPLSIDTTAKAGSTQSKKRKRKENQKQQQQQHQQKKAATGDLQKKNQQQFAYVCRLCGIPGHHVSKCPKPDPDALILSEGYICKRCNKPGHHIRFCPLNNKGQREDPRTNKNGKKQEASLVNSSLVKDLDLSNPAIKDTTLYKIFGDSLPKALSELSNLMPPSTPYKEPSVVPDADGPLKRKERGGKKRQAKAGEQSESKGSPHQKNDPNSERNASIVGNGSLEPQPTQEQPSTTSSQQTKAAPSEKPATFVPRKPIVCRFFKAGQCKRPTCTFSHDLSQELCAFHNIMGGCSKGDSCPYSHEEISAAALEKMLEEHALFKERQKVYIQKKAAAAAGIKMVEPPQETDTPEWLLQIVNPIIVKEQNVAKRDNALVDDGLSTASYPKFKFSSQPQHTGDLDDILNLIPGALGSLRQS
ncbi:Zinc finger CCCH domain-containing protein 4 [Dinochytrium kinnereticum]|nr:Zinc finger CCCH domain-containing protein 4 [Dinochytrium kinnereticum]